MEGIITEKPTLCIVNAEEARALEEWEEMYPDLWLFIAVTREDFSQVYEGKLIATAAAPTEFIEIRRTYRSRGIVNLTTKGIPTGPQPVGIPTCTAG
jgi:hypothetical protein